MTDDLQKVKEALEFYVDQETLEDNPLSHAEEALTLLTAYIERLESDEFQLRVATDIFIVVAQHSSLDAIDCIGDGFHIKAAKAAIKQLNNKGE